MDWERDFSEFSVDDREQQLVSDERLITQLRARQLTNLEILDRVQVFTGDGSRSLSEWLAARADVSGETARDLVRTMRRTQDKPWIREALKSGEITFDRAEALSRIPEDVGLLEHLDVAGVRREAADRVGVAAEDEAMLASDRFLVMQPNLDKSAWKVWGGLDGETGSVVDRALTEKADELPELPDGTRGTHSWRMATALYVLATGGESPKAQINLFVDADRAIASDGRAGVRVEAGPKAGREILEAVLCDSVGRVIVNTADGIPLKYGRSSRSIPPALRQAVLAKTGGYCAADGCNSRYRVEVHHKIPWSQGGRTDPDNLVALCWFHHHVVVHERGFELYEHPDHGRIRFRKPQVRSREPVLVGAGRAKTQG